MKAGETGLTVEAVLCKVLDEAERGEAEIAPVTVRVQEISAQGASRGTFNLDVRTRLWPVGRYAVSLAVDGKEKILCRWRVA